MLSKLLIAAVTLAITSNAFAADVQTKTWKDKLILSFHGEFGFTRKDNTTNDSVMVNESSDGLGVGLGSLKDFTQFYNPTFGYKITDTISLTTSHEFRYADHTKRPKFTNRFYRSLVTLSKSNILTEKEDGVKLDAAIARRYFDRVSVPGTYGNNRINFTLSKNFGEHNGSLLVQYLANDPKTISNNTTWRHGLEIIPTINLQLTNNLTFTANDDMIINSPWTTGNTVNDYQILHELNFAVFTLKINDQISTYLQMKYNYADQAFYATGTYEDFETYVGVTYNLTPKIVFTAEMGAPTFVSHDGRSGFSKRATKPEFTFYIDAAY